MSAAATLVLIWCILSTASLVGVFLLRREDRIKRQKYLARTQGVASLMNEIKNVHQFNQMIKDFLNEVGLPKMDISTDEEHVTLHITWKMK